LPRKTTSKWTPVELAYLKEHYLVDGSTNVAKALGKERSQVVAKANRLKITDGRIGQIARLHRDQPSGYELSIRTALDELGIVYESSFVIKDKFIVDIKIGNLIIEADGDYWHGHPRFEPLSERQLKQQQRDVARNKYLLACGYQLERIWESDFTTDHLKTILHKHNII
jgi:very-short-patch-repair endonuclease